MLQLPEFSEDEKEKIYEYIRNHNLNEVLEAVLSGLSVIRPNDSIEFIQQSLDQLKDLSYSEIKWDMLIPDDLRPKKKIAVPNALDFILNSSRRRDDEDSEAMAELYLKACNHYSKRILKITFGAIKDFIQVKRDLEREEARKMLIAVNFNHTLMCRMTFKKWKTWARQRSVKTKDATEKMKIVFANYVQQVIFDSWYASAVEAKKTREYFERLERGVQGEGDTDDQEQMHEEGNDPVSLLPIEVSAQIFTKLSLAEMAKCSLVCRSWKVIIQSNALWNKVDLSPFGSKLKDNSLINILTVGRPFVVHLNLQGCNSLTSTGFGYVAQCRNLQDVNFSYTTLTDEIIEDVGFSSGSQMLYLNMSNTQISDKALRSICSFMPHLQYLNVSCCQLVTDKGLYYLSKGRLASQFRHIDLSGCLNVNLNGFKCIGKAFPNLRSFYCNNNRNIDNQSLECVLKGCRKLRSVSLKSCPLLSDEGFIHLAGLPSLTWLRIEGNTRISDRTISALSERCSALRHFYVSDCTRLTEISMRSLAQLRSLVVLNLADCIRINDAAVRAIVEGPSGPIIREMNLTNCIRVTDASLLRISQRCISLHYLVLGHLDQITEAGLEFVAALKSLHYLDLTGCSVQDGGLHNLSGIRKLKHLSLVANTAVSDLGVQKLVSSVAEIESINVSFCVSLSDGAFKNIAYSCRKLTTLGLAGCALVGDMTIQYISGACPFLAQLDISGCVDLTDKALKFIRKGCKNLRVLIMLYCRNMNKGTVSKLKSTIDVVEWNGNIPPPSFKLHLNSVASLVVTQSSTNPNNEQKL